jgi:predicted DNA-binding transcriptional regulator YafY
LNLVYRKPGSAAEETRQVDPYHLANVNGDWYLFAFDHLRRAIRTFVPSRIRSATPTGRRFQKPRRFLLERQLRDSFGIFSTEGEYNVRIRFDREIADYIREKRWHASQEQEELPDGSLELRLRLGSLVEIQRWILGWGGRAQALAPGELVEGVQRAARELLQRHASLTPEAAGSPPSETPQGDSPTAG